MTKKCVNIFVLGAGASVDYGLPVWDQLKDLLIKEITINGAVVISSDVTNRLQHELEEIGPGKKYETVDEMIPKFELEEDEEITGPFFEVVKGLFKSMPRPECAGWIETFVDKNNLEILLNVEANAASDYSTVFINFNYDTLLLSRIVHFFKKKYENTSKPEIREWRLSHGDGSDFAAKFRDCAQAIYHPHGILYLRDGDEARISPKASCHPISKTFRNAYTGGRSPRPNNITHGKDNAISCHDAYENFTFYDIKRRINQLSKSGRPDADIRLILLGVGPDSLELNLNKIFDGEPFNVTQVYYTCTKENEKHIYERYLNRFEAPTKSYQNCRELVEQNTLIPFD